MPLLSRILGWSPPDNEEYVDVTVTSDPLLPLENPTFHISNPNPIKWPCRAASGNFESTSPASSTSTLSTDPESHSERRVKGNRKHTDPTWIARPRNEFILFRCDYVRKHSREGKRIRRVPGAEAEKTLSKQAAEAWHHLPPEERLYWKERANGERNEHARRYPDYRYRPKKIAAGRRRQKRSSPTKATGFLDKRSGAGIDASTSRPESSSLPLTRDPSISDLSTKKAGPRRSLSNPELTITDPVNRRLRSTASHSWITAPVVSTIDGLNFSSSEYTQVPLRLQSAPSFLSRDYSASPMPMPQPSSRVMQTTSSSLLNWNGERMVASTPQPTQFLSSTSVSLLSRIDIANEPMLREFTAGGSPIPRVQLFGINNAHYQSNGDIWMPQLHNYPGEDNATRTAVTDGIGSEAFGASGIPAQEESSVPNATSSLTIYDSRGHVNMPNLVDYGVPIEMLGGRSGSPEALFAIDAEELFNPNY